MFRLFRYLPIAIPMIVRWARSEKGRATIDKGRAFVQKQINNRRK